MMDPKLSAIPGTPIRPPILPPSVSTPFLPPYLPPANQISPRVVPTANFRINLTPPLPFIPSSVTPLSQLPGSSLQNSDKTIPLAPIPGPSLQNCGIMVPPHFPPPSFMPPPVVPPPLISPISAPPGIESANNHNWKGILSKSGLNYCSLYAVREESDLCRYLNGASEPKE